MINQVNFRHLDSGATIAFCGIDSILTFKGATLANTFEHETAILCKLDNDDNIAALIEYLYLATAYDVRTLKDIQELIDEGYIELG